MGAGRDIPDVLAGLPRTEKAIAYAERLHDGQRRRADGAPFIAHPIEVAELLREAGAGDQVIAAGVLHDTIEKTPAHPADLRRRFGREITSLVLAVTDDARIAGYERRKAALREQVATAGPDALMIFAADKISKLRELARERDARPRTRRSYRRRVSHYRDCLALLEARLGDSPLVAQLRQEFDRFQADQRFEPLVAGPRR